MKKTLLSAVAGLAVIGSACAAGPDTCNPDKYVWVERDELCIPKNPCKSKSEVIRNAYCNTVFKDVQLSNWRDGVKVVKQYLNKRRGVDMTNTQDIGNTKDTSFFGQDYIPAKTTDGGYVVFEFDDLSDLGGADVRVGITKAVCKIYAGNGEHWALTDEKGEANFGGWTSADINNDGRNFVCAGVSESDCQEIEKMVMELRDGHLVGTRYMDSWCYLTLEK